MKSIPRGPRGLSRTGMLWDVMGCYGMLWDVMGCYGLYGLQWGAIQLPVIKT